MSYACSVCVGSSADVELPKKRLKVELDEPDDVSTVMHGKVRVTPQGYIHVINKASAPYIEKANKGKKINDW